MPVTGQVAFRTADVGDMSTAESAGGTREERVRQVWLAHPAQGSGPGISTTASGDAFAAQQFNRQRVAWKGLSGIILKIDDQHWGGTGISPTGRVTGWNAIIDGWERQLADKGEPPEVADMLDAAEVAAGR